MSACSSVDITQICYDSSSAMTKCGETISLQAFSVFLQGTDYTFPLFFCHVFIISLLQSLLMFALDKHIPESM